MYKRYFNDLKAITGTERLIDWAYTKHITVVFETAFNKVNAIGATYIDKTVTINAQIGIINQMMFLLHELGHFLLEESKTYLSNYPYGWKSKVYSNPRRQTACIHRLDVVGEEFEAWTRGRMLAERLGIDLDREKFDAVRVVTLRSYLEWVLRVGDFKKNSNL